MERCLEEQIYQLDTLGFEQVNTRHRQSRNEVCSEQPSSREWLDCSIASCAFRALLRRPGVAQPFISVTTNSDSAPISKFCHNKEAEYRQLINMVDQAGCQSATIAYILQKFGAHTAPEVVDEWMEREPEHFPSEIGEYKLLLELLRRDYEVKLIFPKNAMNRLRPFFGNTPYDIGQYISQWHEYTANADMLNWFDSDSFLECEAEIQEYLPYFIDEAKPFISSSQFTVDFEDINVEALANHTRKWGVMAKRAYENMQRTSFALHAVAVENITYDATGRIRAEFYTSRSNEPAVIASVRSSELQNIFFTSPDFSYLLINPRTSEPAVKQ